MAIRTIFMRKQMATPTLNQLRQLFSQKSISHLSCGKAYQNYGFLLQGRPLYSVLQQMAYVGVLTS